MRQKIVPRALIEEWLPTPRNGSGLVAFDNSHGTWHLRTKLIGLPVSKSESNVVDFARPADSNSNVILTLFMCGTVSSLAFDSHFLAELTYVSSATAATSRGRSTRMYGEFGQAVC